VDVVKETIFPPQQKPTTPQVPMLLYLDSISLRMVGIFAAVAGGAPVVEKKFPSFSPFSLVSGGYQEMSAGLPSNQSGMKTWYLLWSSAVERMSAPWRD